MASVVLLAHAAFECLFAATTLYDPMLLFGSAATGSGAVQLGVSLLAAFFAVSALTGLLAAFAASNVKRLVCFTHFFYHALALSFMFKNLAGVDAFGKGANAFVSKFVPPVGAFLATRSAAEVQQGGRYLLFGMHAFLLICMALVLLFSKSAPKPAAASQQVKPKKD